MSGTPDAFLSCEGDNRCSYDEAENECKSKCTDADTETCTGLRQGDGHLACYFETGKCRPLPIKAWFEAHKHFRCKRDAEKLMWDDTIATKVQDWLDSQCDNNASDVAVAQSRCAKASAEQLRAFTRYGDHEEIAWENTRVTVADDAVKSEYEVVQKWYDEGARLYTDFNPAQTDIAKEQFTFSGLVWKGATRFGCGRQFVGPNTYYRCWYLSVLGIDVNTRTKRAFTNNVIYPESDAVCVNPFEAATK